MRVIAGTARSMPLQTVEGLETRPTTDRIKETLFNILQNQVPQSRFLDLFSGSGAIGIEALSRGAREAVFVENNRRAAECIRKNLEFTRLSARGRVMETDVLAAIERLKGQESFDLIYMDPPYRMGAEKAVFQALSASGLMGRETLLIVEAGLETDFSFSEETGMEICREKRYKTNRHLFLRRKI